MGAVPQGEPADAGREDGASVFDLAHLAPVPRRVMRLIMREVEMGYADLCGAMAQLPAGERNGGADLDDALAQLTGQGWLVTSGTDEGRRYRVSLPRRSGRPLTQVRPRRQSGSSLGKTIWEALESGATGEWDAGGGADPPDAELRPPAQTPREE